MDASLMVARDPVLTVVLGLSIVGLIGAIWFGYLLWPPRPEPWASDARKVAPGSVVLHPEVFDFAHARRVREQWLTEQAFLKTTWGEDGTIQ